MNITTGWQLFGFDTETSVTPGPATSGSFIVDQIPTTGDLILWDLPVDGPIADNTLEVFINGLNQSELEFELQPDKMSFLWISSDPLYLDDNVRCNFGF